MVIIGINGRLGNQMFCFALYQCMLKMKKDVFVDLACNRANGEQGIWSDVKYNVEMFGLDYRIADEDIAMEMLEDGRDRNIWKRWEYRLAPSRCKFYEEKNQGTFDKRIFELDDVYLHGYWQTQKYFVKVADDIRRMYQFPDSFSDYQKRLLSEMTDKYSVSVHIRRGDYLWRPDLYGTVNLEYYKNAMEYIQKRKENVYFYVFTDDIPWVKRNIKGNNIKVVENDSDDLLTKNLDMALMAECKDNIIANSSFSWWAAWLNKNQDKIVIAPRKWEVNKSTRDIWCKDWIKM